MQPTQPKKDDKGKNPQNSQSRDKDDKLHEKPPKRPQGMFNTYTPLTVLPVTVYKEVMNSEIRDRQPPLRTQDGIKTVIVIIIGRRVIQKMNVFNSEMPSRS